ncbi:MAG: 4Fe-4S dicluster domain-containing protein [Chloroflexota bacterium]
MPQNTKARKGKSVRIELNQGWCKGCGICVEMCPTDVFGAEEGTGKAFVAAAESCVDCGMCELYCPDYAISLERDTEE